MEELWQQYQIRKKVGKTWLKKEKWALLLDGLDEVKPQHRDACVNALNQFRQNFGNVEIALCCRIAEYNALNIHLERFQSAVSVQPLTEKQVNDYLQKGGRALAGIASALAADSSLQDLANTPLFLWVLTLAYRNHPAQELLNLPEDQRLKLLFDRYIERMFTQRPLPKSEQQKMLCWLTEIARQIGTDKEFLIERMQPRIWLKITREQWLYGLILGLILGLVLGLIYGLILGLLGRWILGLSLGLIYGIIFGLSGRLKNIILVESLEISFSRKIKNKNSESLRKWMINGLLDGLLFGLIIGLIFGILYGPIPGLLGGLLGELIYGSIYGLIFGLISNLKVDITTRSSPNQGVWDSLKTMVITVVISLIFTISFYYYIANVLPLFVGPSLGRGIVISCIGLPVWFSIVAGGGLACIQHFAMRLVLFQTKKIPWDFVTFLKQAEDRLFIYRTGGSYVFVHRYLQEHFASLSFDET